jgi:excisionase family DNA binding protein
VLNIGTRSVERWAREGRLPRVELGRRTIRFRASDIAALIDHENDHEAATNGPAEKVGIASARREV